MSALANYIAAWHSNSADFQHLFDNAVGVLQTGDTVLKADEVIADGKLIITHQEALQGAVAPLVQKDDLIWQHRIWVKEKQLAESLLQRNEPPLVEEDLTEIISRGLKKEQARAVQHALSHRLTIINGGPGTGKTFTVARIVRAMLAVKPDLQIALAAPTGKAANRMQESLQNTFSRARDAQNIYSHIDAAKTLHRLLEINSNSIAGFHAANRLAYDLVIIDEASMLSLELAHMLFQALREDATLILLGDADQLAAVDPGAVLHDISHQEAMKNIVVTLKDSQRFDVHSGIAKLAEIVREGSAQSNVLQTIMEESADITWYSEIKKDWYDKLFSPFSTLLDAISEKHEEAELLTIFDNYRILTAGHYGKFGDSAINLEMRKRHLKALGLSLDTQNYLGKPVMVTRNDYSNHLFNGDIGICVENDEGSFDVLFAGIGRVPLSYLAEENLTLAYALTIHKSQGSEFHHVSLILDPKAQKGLSRELVYTGITRAKQHLSCYFSLKSIITAIQTPTKRSTGLDCFLRTAVDI